MFTSSNIKRGLSFLLALILALSLFSCQSSEEKKPEEIPEEQGNAELPGLPEVNRVEVDADELKRDAVNALNSLAYTNLSETNGITVASASPTSFITEAGDTAYSYALSQRNQMFEKKFSTKLTLFSEDTQTVLESAYYDMLSGLEYADLLCVPANELNKFITKGVLLDIKSLSGSDYSADYFNSELMKNASAGGESYAVYGDFTQDFGSYNCLYLNETLLTRAGLELPYKAVESGEWTWDKLLELCRNANAASGGVSLSLNSSSDLTDLCFKSAGENYLITGAGVTPTVKFASDGTQGLLELLRKFNSSGTLLFNSENDAKLKSFTYGSTVFMAGSTADMKRVKTTTARWGVLPLPKKDSTQENYFSYLTDDHPVLCVYAGAQTEGLFEAIAGLNAASCGGYLTQAYYKDLIFSHLPSSNALNMLDYIYGTKCSKPINDFTDIYSPLYPELKKHTTEEITSAAAGNTVHIFMAEKNSAARLDPLLEIYFPYN